MTSIIRALEALNRCVMSLEDVPSSVEAIEAEAEKVLEEARTRATEILLRAKGEVDKILSSELPMAEVKAECDKTIYRAREEAQRMVEASARKASEIRTNAERKVEEISQRMVRIIAGENSK